MSDRNWRPEGGEWEPIKISLEIDPSAYIPKITASPQPKVGDNSYELAISQQHTLGNFAEAKRVESQNRTAETDQTASGHRTDRSDRSDRLSTPVRPVAPRQPVNQLSKVESRANEVQIQRNLGDTFTPVP